MRLNIAAEPSASYTAIYFAPAAQYSTTPETLYNYANYLKLTGQKSEAREWAQKLVAKKRALPGYMQRVERPWFRKGKALQKELAVYPGAIRSPPAAGGFPPSDERCVHTIEERRLCEILVSSILNTPVT